MTGRTDYSKTKLEDLNRDELLVLVRRQMFQPDLGDLLEAKWHALVNAAANKAAAACEAQKRALVDDTPEGFKAFEAASKEFDESQKMYARADELHKHVLRAITERGGRK